MFGPRPVDAHDRSARPVFSPETSAAIIESARRSLFHVNRLGSFTGPFALLIAFGLFVPVIIFVAFVIRGDTWGAMYVGLFMPTFLVVLVPPALVTRAQRRFVHRAADLAMLPSQLPQFNAFVAILERTLVGYRVAWIVVDGALLLKISSAIFTLVVLAIGIIAKTNATNNFDSRQ